MPATRARESSAKLSALIGETCFAAMNEVFHGTSKGQEHDEGVAWGIQVQPVAPLDLSMPAFCHLKKRDTAGFHLTMGLGAKVKRKKTEFRQFSNGK